MKCRVKVNIVSEGKPIRFVCTMNSLNTGSALCSVLDSVLRVYGEQAQVRASFVQRVDERQ